MIATTWFYGAGIPPIPRPIQESEHLRREMERVADLFLAIPTEAGRREFALSTFGRKEEGK